MQVDEREGHGWWPYVVPYATFLVITQLAGRFPDAAQPWILALKPSVVLGLVVWFRTRGAYPEWLDRPPVRMTVWGGIQDVVVGLLLTAVWVAPFVAFPALRPEPGGEFDPAMAGEAFVPLVLGLRLFGYALVTPIFEELFIRSFVLRIADVWDSEHDFRDQPIARYTLRSLIVGTVVFTSGHVFWEYLVCVPWFVLSCAWFYRRRNLTALMLVHGTTNGALLALAAFGEAWLRDANGDPFSFWFFV